MAEEKKEEKKKGAWHGYFLSSPPNFFNHVVIPLGVLVAVNYLCNHYFTNIKPFASYHLSQAAGEAGIQFAGFALHLLDTWMNAIIALAIFIFIWKKAFGKKH